MVTALDGGTFVSGDVDNGASRIVFPLWLDLILSSLGLRAASPVSRDVRSPSLETTAETIFSEETNVLELGWRFICVCSGSSAALVRSDIEILPSPDCGGAASRSGFLDGREGAELFDRFNDGCDLLGTASICCGCRSGLSTNSYEKSRSCPTGTDCRGFVDASSRFEEEGCAGGANGKGRV